MERPSVEQRFATAEAANGSLLFQGYVSGPIHINHQSQAKQHVPQHIIPFPPNEDVVDRGFSAVLDRLLPPGGGSHSAALWGLGGSGKTQIALDYAYRRSRDAACSVFWVHADNATTFTHDYKLIANRLGVVGTLQGSELLMAVRQRIETDPCWLLVLDNVDDLAAFGVFPDPSGAGKTHSLYDFVPRGPTGTVLWTSRDKRIGGSLVSTKRAINVSNMTAGEAMILLETVMGKSVDEEPQNAAELLTELECLPLAISQAAAYMRRTLTPIGEYLKKLTERRGRWKLLQDTEFDRHRRQHVANSVLQTWDMSIEQIRSEDELAYNVLHSLAFIDNQSIPFELIAAGAKRMRHPTKHDRATRDDTTRSDDQGQQQDHDCKDEVMSAVVLLQDFSFLRLQLLDKQGHSYEMHKFVQEAVQYSLSQQHQQGDEAYFSRVAIQAVTHLFPPGEEPNPGERDQCEKYLAHAQHAAKWAHLCEGEIEAAALLTRVSHYLSHCGRWIELSSVDKCAYEYRKKALGEKHPDTIDSLANLGDVNHLQGLHSEAEEMKMKVIELRREVLGAKHPDTIWSIAKLGSANFAQGRLDNAEKVLTDVLPMLREVLGETHFRTIQVMHGLAATFCSQGRYDEAKTIYTDVIPLQHNLPSEKYHIILQNMEGLGTVHHAQGQLDEAKKIKMEVLKLRRKVLGLKHPDTIWSMDHLAFTYNAQGRHSEAEKIQVDALRLWREVLGERHLHTIRSISELGATYHIQGKYDKNEEFAANALALHQEVLGMKHPFTIRAMSDLVQTYYAQEKYKDAEKLQTDLFILQKETWGTKHQNTRNSMAVLGAIYQAQGRYAVAEEMAAEVLALWRESLGRTHTSTMLAMSNLAKVYYAQKKYDEAEPLQTEVLRLLREHGLGRYPAALHDMYCLACTLDCLGRWSDSLALLQECFQLQCEVLGSDHPEAQKSLRHLRLLKADTRERIRSALGRVAHRFKGKTSK